LSRLDRELAEEDDEEADEDEDEEEELDPVELGAVALMFVDGEVFRRAADDDAAMAARMNGAFMTVSTLDARK